MDKRLDFLLKDDPTKIDQSLKNEYEKQYLSKKTKEQELIKKRDQLQLFQKQLSNIQSFNSNKENLKNIKRALNYIHKKDLVALKFIYDYLFQQILVQPLDESKVQLHFVFKRNPATAQIFEDIYCPMRKMVETNRIELSTSTMPL